MTKYLYLYQLENYETPRFLKRVYRGFLKKSATKKPVFGWDLKARFIIYFSILLYVVAAALLLVFLPIYISTPAILILWILRFILLVLAEKLFSQYEKRSNAKLFENAKQKVNTFSEVAFIGIAGSSGKSSLLAILEKLLGEKTISTKNISGGIHDLTQLVNEKLTLSVKHFICEFNTNKKGQILKMCQLTKPKIGILTNINEQHLERYKDIENTIASKFELLNNLGDNGIGIVNLDNSLIRENLKLVTSQAKLIGFSLDGNNSSLCHDAFSVSRYEIHEYGSKFTLMIAGDEYNFSTALIGKSNLSNTVAAVVCAIELGKDPEKLEQLINNLKQIPHAMEQKIRNNIYILDNTCGSNVDGFRNNLEILNMHKRKKVLVTPGIYEIGEKSKEVHKLLGYMTSQVADLIILLGESFRTENIRAGALDNGFDKNKIIRVRDLDEVYRFIDKNLNEGDVVLLENGLDDRFI